ncbi:NAD-dependent malic enzyme [Ereboglobus luteus]|uniref:NAD-dependent malic enzyme n=1 Tax=Ereboglobus luteus TaxID=1796921 RepID=A0A2U8E2P4_9BACT|nr:NAD-dependent malic enzyme [Ereboglobus luteus]AWI09149.1 NAD-dependent malic enzyme [Ereboglobus luteus]
MHSEQLSANGVSPMPHGYALMTNPALNKGTCFSERERDALGLRGLLPPRAFSLEEQMRRALGNMRRKPDALEKYIFLTTLQTRNETLYYRLLQDNIEETMPLVYTPTVGQACLEYGSIFRRPRGLFISLREKGRVAEVLRNWPIADVRMIVVTDGERILGLGDLGALGMGIPVGKLSLYTACAGVHPSYCLPITIDVGTDNGKLLDDPFYIGLQQKRVRGAEYDELLREFVEAVKTVYPKALLQWEDFGNTNAFRLLEENRKNLLSFNDDIQGTAAVAIGGLIASLRLTGKKLTDQRLLFLGAGEAGTGIGELFTAAAQKAGLSEADARACCWYVDSQGLVVKNRPGKPLAHHKLPFAHDHAPVATLAEAVEAVKPTALIGVSGMPRTFTEQIIRRMGELNKRPVIFALSNPTSRAECTAEDAYKWTEGRAIFASGSPFDPVTIDGKTHHPGQGNNVYIFPGVGLGALACGAREVTDRMFLAAAETLAGQVTQADLDLGRVYPALTKIRDVSAKIAAAVAEEAHRENLATTPRPADIEADIKAKMYEPAYREFE